MVKCDFLITLELVDLFTDFHFKRFFDNRIEVWLCVWANIARPSMPIGTYNLSKGTHPLGGVMGLPEYIGGYIGTDMQTLA